MRAILITGAGDKAFAAGTDISQFREFDTPEDALAYEERIDRVLTALEECPSRPSPRSTAPAPAAARRSPRAATCASPRKAMSIGFPVARTLGNCLSLANYSRLVVPGRPGAGEGHRVPRAADRGGRGAGHRAGQRALQDQAALHAARGGDRATVGGHAPLTLQATKEALLRLRPKIAHGEGNDLVLMCYMSQDFREGMQNFLAKRPMQWTGT